MKEFIVGSTLAAALVALIALGVSWIVSEPTPATSKPSLPSSPLQKISGDTWRDRGNGCEYLVFYGRPIHRLGPDGKPLCRGAQ